jgi:hypothetical protein
MSEEVKDTVASIDELAEQFFVAGFKAGLKQYGLLWRLNQKTVEEQAKEQFKRIVKD